MWVAVPFPERFPAGKLPQGGGQIVNVSRSPPEDQVSVIRISSIQSNVLLLDCKIKGVPVSAVVDCDSPICILSNEVFKGIGRSGPRSWVLRAHSWTSWELWN